MIFKQFLQKKIENFYPILILLIGLIFYLPFLNAVHLFDWDEINFAEMAREMLITEDYFLAQVNFQPFWEKPPFFFWLQVLSMKIFGINAFAARFPNAIFGVLQLILLFYIGKKLKNANFGFLWALLFGTAFLPFLYFKSGIIDPVFNFFIFFSFYLFFEAYQSEKNGKILAFCAGLLNGLAILTKGPVGFLLPILSFFVLFLFKKIKFSKVFLLFFIFSFSALSVTSLWFLPEVFSRGTWFLFTFFEYQLELLTQPVAGHAQPFYYHFLIVFLGCFPMSFYALPTLFSNKKILFSTKKEEDLSFWLRILFWVVLLLFSAVKTKIAHYSSMTYAPLSFLATLSIYHFWQTKKDLPKYLKFLWVFFGTICGILFLTLPLIIKYKTYLLPYIQDVFARDCLATEVFISWQLVLFSALFLVFFGIIIYLLIQKKWMTAVIFQAFLSGSFLLFYLKLMVPEIEKHSQGPAIEFYQDLKHQKIFINTYGFKSYAQLFYFEKPYESKEILAQSNDFETLLNQKIDRPVYLVTKSHNVDLDQREDFVLIKKKGGFKLYRKIQN